MTVVFKNLTCKGKIKKADVFNTRLSIKLFKNF